MNFKEYINRIEEDNTVGYHNDGPGGPHARMAGAYTTSDMTDSEGFPTMIGHPLHLPSHDLALSVPTVNKVAKIQVIEKNKNPIFVMLDDGTKLHITLDEFNRIKGNKPEVGRIMKVTFQRRLNDKSKDNSKIISIKII